MDITDIKPLFTAVYNLIEDNGVFVFATQHPCLLQRIYVLRSNLTAMRGGRVCTASHVYFLPVGFTAGDGGGE